jgi:hypothetical protein
MGANPPPLRQKPLLLPGAVFSDSTIFRNVNRRVIRVHDKNDKHSALRRSHRLVPDRTVEAARAGEQGRGFAVVASEVRSLAQRSAGAAREIKELISTSLNRVQQGTALVGQAGETMNEVVAAIEKVAGIMGEISVASGQRSAGVTQVSDAVTQMDQSTQQNAALVERSASAADSLRAQARQLVQAVAIFKTGRAADRSPAAIH